MLRTSIDGSYDHSQLDDTLPPLCLPLQLHSSTDGVLVTENNEANRDACWVVGSCGHSRLACAIPPLCRSLQLHRSTGEVVVTENSEALIQRGAGIESSTLSSTPLSKWALPFACGAAAHAILPIGTEGDDGETSTHQIADGDANPSLQYICMSCGDFTSSRVSLPPMRTSCMLWLHW